MCSSTKCVSFKFPPRTLKIKRRKNAGTLMKAWNFLLTRGGNQSVKRNKDRKRKQTLKGWFIPQCDWLIVGGLTSSGKYFIHQEESSMWQSHGVLINVEWGWMPALLQWNYQPWKSLYDYDYDYGQKSTIITPPSISLYYWCS